MVQSLVSTSLLEPKTVISHGEALFKELLAWGAKTAISECHIHSCYINA